ncbi:MAG: class I SAM-dependent methyltransferase [Nanoarchaeota archaeon]
MEKPAFYDKEKAQSREDFFRDNAPTASSASDLFFNLIYGGVSAGSKILDIGTGNAYVLEQLAKRYPLRYSSLWGVDISPEMLEKAKERTSGLDIQLFLGDNITLPFESDFFDVVTAKNVTNFSESMVLERD